MHKILINGEWVDALSGTSREIKNPATLELLGTVQDCGSADVAHAVAAAKAAQRGWWKVPGVEKAKLLREVVPEGLDAFREPKHVHLDWVMERKPWFFPYRDRKP